MKKIILTTLLLSSGLILFAQTKQEEAQQKKFRYNNPYAPQKRHSPNIEYKLFGYTDTTQIVYTPYSKCKMMCLSIDDNTVREILKNGIVNVSKSELRSTPKKYLVECQYSGKNYAALVTPNNKALLLISINRLHRKVDCDCEGNKKS